MNKVLIICSNFLPVRNGGTIRSEKLTKYLPFYDWNSIVLTKKVNNTNSFNVIDNIPIYRSREFDVASSLLKIKNTLGDFFRKNKNTVVAPKNTITNVKRRFSDYFLLPDADIFWALGTIFKSIKVFRNEQPNVVLSTGPSHSVHIVGLFVSFIFNRYWVVEFRDP
jgi:hypothetical protein